MPVSFQHIHPHPMLQPFIEKIWLFNCDGKMPVEDFKLVVPNGNIKLTLPIRNGIIADMHGQRYSSKENSICLTGVVDVPLILDVKEDTPASTIGIEFNPKGAYRFFHLSFDELKNQIFLFDDLFNRKGKMLEEQIANAFSIAEKINLLQNFLLSQLSVYGEDNIFDYCIAEICKSNGAISIAGLEKKTGYSSRWLNMKFSEKLGISPKNFSAIIRFKQYFQLFTSGQLYYKKDFYQYYYDQSHFIKSFKRFTGHLPSHFDHRLNDFGKKFYEG